MRTRQAVKNHTLKDAIVCPANAEVTVYLVRGNMSFCQDANGNKFATRTENLEDSEPNPPPEISNADTIAAPTVNTTNKNKSKPEGNPLQTTLF